MAEERRSYASINEKLDEVLHQLAYLERAFPDGVEPHRAAHEAMISASRAEERFWTELKLDVAKKGVWGILVIIIGLVVVGVSVKLGISKPL